MLLRSNGQSLIWWRIIDVYTKEVDVTLPAAFAEPASDVSARLDREGYVRVAGALPANRLTTACGEIQEWISVHGQGDHELFDPEDWDCPTLSALATDPELEGVLASLAHHGSPRAIGIEGYDRRVLRILTGAGGEHSMPFVWHYDACAITVIVPIVVPDDGSGDLAAFTNSRPHRRSVIVNLAEKVAAQSPSRRHRFTQRFLSDPPAYTIPLVPGDAHVFRGYRTIHATLPRPADALRVTLVLQYGHPYGSDNSTLRFARSVGARLLRGRHPEGTRGSYH
jgi:hypothetical protein